MTDWQHMSIHLDCWMNDWQGISIHLQHLWLSGFLWLRRGGWITQMATESEGRWMDLQHPRVSLFLWTNSAQTGTFLYLTVCDCAR
jgi:hypothetical protein